MDLPLYGPARRTRGGSNSSSSNQVAYCLVDGCNSDLSKCRDYHRRHKVCEVHSKTPKVTIRGQEQRFCQQCSRFHSLTEFDDAKRSCRKRLDGHNRRRRKSQPDPSLLNPTQLLSDFHDAAKYFQPTGAQVFATSSTASCSWLGAVKPRNSEEYFSSSRHEMSLNFSDRKEQIQFPFLQGTQHQEPNVVRAPASVSSSAHGEGCGQELFLGTVNPESNRALSLLSSLQQPHTEASTGKGINVFNTSSQPLHPSDHYESGAAGVLVSQGGMFFQIRHDASNSSLHLDHRTSSSWQQ